jgi:hypothetical protein
MSLIFGGKQAAKGTKRAVLLALKVGDVLPELDPWAVRQWTAAARHYGIRLSRVDGGLKRVS